MKFKTGTKASSIQDSIKALEDLLSGNQVQAKYIRKSLIMKDIKALQAQLDKTAARVEKVYNDNGSVAYVCDQCGYELAVKFKGVSSGKPEVCPGCGAVILRDL